MKRIRQSRLCFREGSSDKVYEVDLCQVDADKYVVNFRYGRRGSNLREGTKTSISVSLAEAERIFTNLVASKVKKGYREDSGVSQQGGSSPSPDSSPPAQAAAEREVAVLAALRGESPSWSVSRAIWRAGQLELAAAAPLLEPMLTDGIAPLREYSIIWALGRIGSPSSKQRLHRLVTAGMGDINRRLASEAIRLLCNDDERQQWTQSAWELVHPDIRAHKDDPAKLVETVMDRVSTEAKTYARSLYPLYFADHVGAHQAVAQAMRSVPLSANYFAQMRSIFKAAEFRRDAMMFGIIAHRFANTRPAVWSWDFDDQGGELSGPPFMRTTRNYLRRRVWRTLRQLGRDESPDFVRMATGVLLPYKDTDRQRPVERHYEPWSGSSRTLRWGPWGHTWTLSHLLFGNSNRFIPHSASTYFRVRDGAQADATPTKREESFSHLWDRTPQALLHLLDESRCEDVHRFAVKAVRDNHEFLAGLDVEAVVMIVSAPYEVTAEFGFELAQRYYDATNPNRRLVRAVISSVFALGRKQAQSWVRAHRPRFTTDSEFMATLILSRYGDNRSFVRALLTGAALSEDNARLIIGRVVAKLADASTLTHQQIAEAGDTLLGIFPREMATIGEQIIRDLLASPSVQVQEFGAKILLAHRTFATKPPDDILLALIDSRHGPIRKIGARLLGQLSDSDLLERRELIVHLASHELEDLRDGIRPALGRLVTQNHAFARSLAQLFATTLLRANPKGVPAHLVSLLTNELADQLGEVGRDLTLSLLRAKSPHAQELGGLLLARNLSADDLSITEMVRLASHDIRSVRKGIWAMCEANIDRLKLAMHGVVGLLDAKWDDSRQWALDFFERAFDDSDLSPAILVSICDSVRPQVQAFGRKLILERFQTTDGNEYVSKLSEHPSSDIQLFVSNFLERYAAGELDRLRQLRPYFLRVLSNINRGRVARQRCIAFLRAQAETNRDIAELVAQIFARQSATIAITHREPMIVAMAEIHRRYPDIALPIRFVPVEARHGV